MNRSVEKPKSKGRARRAWPLTAAALLLGSPVLAADNEPAHNAFEITPLVGYMFGGEFEDPLDGTDRDLDADAAFGVIFNIADDYWRHYEFLYTRQSTQLEGADNIDMDVQYLQLGGIVSNPEAKYAIPYFGLTVGAALFSPDQSGLDDETNFAFSAAGGVRVPITDHIGVRFDARAFVTLFDSSGDVFCVSSGGATCRIRVKSDAFLQYAASLGVIIGF
ncbi:MAG TPA: hypothetical protein VHK24_10920 [Steroidobacter sp.]|jgi:hypothetical protein|nr:hypothetical protein [Steroidobacter sp.]